MASELTRSAERSARALSASICDRLVIDDDLDGQEIFRASKTLATLVGSLLDERSGGPDVALLLDQVLIGLAVRLGESIDGDDEESSYHLARAMDLVTGLKRRCRRQLAG